VSDPEGGLSVVAEVKLVLGDADAAERQLTRYMFGMRCPVGMLVTPDRVRGYRDTYREQGEGSVERVVEFETPPSLAKEIPPLEGSSAERATLFERAVQSWVERLAQGSELADLPPDARQALEENVLPALRRGEVRAGHPRWRRTGT